MSEAVIPQVESPVEATEAEAVQAEVAPKESQESEEAPPVTQEQPEDAPVESQQKDETEAVKRSVDELSQASQEEVVVKKVRVLEGGDNPQSQEVPAEV